MCAQSKSTGIKLGIPHDEVAEMDMIEATWQQAVGDEVNRRFDRRGFTLEVPVSERKPATRSAMAEMIIATPF